MEREQAEFLAHPAVVALLGFLDAREVLVEVPAGSIAVWHSLTLHSSHPNNSDRPRRAIAFGYKDPSTALLSGSFNASETRQVGMIVRGVDPRGQLLSAL